VKESAGTGEVTATPIFASLAEFLAWVQSNAVNGGEYAYTLTSNETLAPTTLNYGGKNVTIIIQGDASMRTVSLSAKGSLFTINSGVTLVLENNVTLKGRSDNSTRLVYVASSGVLTMNGNVTVTGNKIVSSSAPYCYGGGVYVAGTFTMNDNAIISGNTSMGYGGGVYAPGTFTMNGNASVSSNTCVPQSYGWATYGGGVYVRSGTFIMNDSATVSGNTASHYGGGVYLGSGSGSAAIFTMNDNSAVKSNNSSYGGGVSIGSDNTGDAGTFTMNDNSCLSGNNGRIFGGGVYVAAKVDRITKFTKNGGIIYGSNATGVDVNNKPFKNSSGYGAALCLGYGLYRETTATITQNFSVQYNNGWNFSGQWRD
jgi:hypothetical protein